MIRKILGLTLVVVMVTMMMVEESNGKQTSCESTADKLNIRCFKQNSAANTLIVKPKVNGKGTFKVLINKYQCSKEAETKEKVSTYQKTATVKKPADVKFQAAGGLDDCAEALIQNCAINRVEKQCDTIFEISIDPPNTY